MVQRGNAGHGWWVDWVKEDYYNLTFSWHWQESHRALTGASEISSLSHEMLKSVLGVGWGVSHCDGGEDKVLDGGSLKLCIDECISHSGPWRWWYPEAWFHQLWHWWIARELKWGKIKVHDNFHHLVYFEPQVVLCPLGCPLHCPCRLNHLVLCSNETVKKCPDADEFDKAHNICFLQEQNTCSVFNWFYHSQIRASPSKL